MELPIYELRIQEDLADDAEVSFVALVDKPAIQKDFLVFNEPKLAFAIQDDEQHIISGPLMLAMNLSFAIMQSMGNTSSNFQPKQLRK